MMKQFCCCLAAAAVLCLTAPSAVAQEPASENASGQEGDIAAFHAEIEQLREELNQVRGTLNELKQSIADSRRDLGEPATPAPSAGTSAEEEEIESLEVLIRQRARVDELIREFVEESPAGYRRVLGDIAELIRDAISDLEKVSRVSEEDNRDQIKQVRQQLRQEIGNVLLEAFKGDTETYSQWAKALEGILNELKATERPNVGELQEFYTRVADSLDEAAQPADERAVELGGITRSEIEQLDAWDTISDDLKRRLKKFSKSDEATYKRHVEEYAQVLEDIVATVYEENEVDAIKENTRRATLDFIGENVINKKSRQLWREAYNKFVEWAEQSPRLDARSVEGWKRAITLLAESLTSSAGAYAAWIEQAKQRLDSRGTSARRATADDGYDYSPRGSRPFGRYWRRRHWLFHHYHGY